MCLLFDMTCHILKYALHNLIFPISMVELLFVTVLLIDEEWVGVQLDT